MKEKFQGCLLGIAVGDMLGTATKYKTHLVQSPLINTHLDNLLNNLQVDIHQPPLESLLCTDDSDLMGLTLESICTQRALDIPDLVRRLKGWYNSHPLETTPLTGHVLSRLNNGEKWEEASEGASFDTEFDPPDGGNLTRCIPIGLYRSKNLEKLIEETTIVSKLTHWDKKCIDAALALNYTLVGILKNNDQIIGSLLSFISKNNKTAITALTNASENSIEKLDISGSTLGAFSVGLWAFKNASSFEEGIKKVLELGHATDTNAAVAGGLLGAKFERSSIPEAWLFNLESKARIEVLATRLFEHAYNSNSQ